MKGVFTAAVLIAALMVGVKDHGLLQRAGLTGSCASIQAPQGDDHDWRRCTPGRLSGSPDLTRQSCIREGAAGDVAFWRCPAAVQSSPTAGG
jgi:hypothetical protein